MENITSIPEGNYQGYIWMSDKEQPEIFKGEYHDKTTLPNTTPFIIEAQLFDGISGESYSVRFIDGDYIVNNVNVNTLKGDVQDQFFPASFPGAPGKLHFKSVWREEKDSLCEGMMVLTPHEFVFVGFKL